MKIKQAKLASQQYSLSLSFSPNFFSLFTSLMLGRPSFASGLAPRQLARPVALTTSSAATLGLARFASPALWVRFVASEGRGRGPKDVVYRRGRGGAARWEENRMWGGGNEAAPWRKELRISAWRCDSAAVLLEREILWKKFGILSSSLILNRLRLLQPNLIS